MKKKLLQFLVLSLSLMFISTTTSAQGVKGKVKDATTGQSLVGATIKVDGSDKGAIADMRGAFEIKLKQGSYTLKVSYVGYETKSIDVKVGSEMKNLGSVRLNAESIGLGGVSIIADRAKERETPVAISNIDAKQLEEQLGSRDIPLIMNNTPSVYATAQGGGAGDARINVRGFNQRNVAIMINGVPVNDMENGWVYWSNWDGIADATSSIQMQRGLSAVNLATPSIGGTMNIVTSPAENKAGVSGRFEYGSGNFMKSTITGHTGLIDNKYAVSASVVRKVGDGVIDGTWTDAWAYYLGASYNLNKNHRLEVYAMGAPQRHGQNLYKQNVATYDAEYAKEIGADSAVGVFTEMGRTYNQNWAKVDESYDGKQYWNGKEHDRYAKDFINERENFYHKPLANLNWYAKWSDKISQYTTLYYSGGVGGGTGTYGDVYRRDADGELGDDDYKFYYGPSPWQWDWNEQIKMNSGDAGAYYVDKDSLYKEDGQSLGILRNSRNNQNTVGAISKVKVEVNEKLKFQVGLDWRTATIEHFREVRDLLGGSYYNYSGNAFDETADDYKKGLGDKIAYNFTNTVDWLGAYIQGEYKTDKLSVYGTYGHSMIKYSYTNHFAKNEAGDGELKANTNWVNGNQIKGGLNYNIFENLSVFGNIGLISKAPIFDNIINDRDGTVADDPQNEDFTAFEFGTIFSNNDDNLSIKANYYNTLWENRALNLGVTNQDGSEGFIFVNGMNQRHTGFEFEVKYQPIKQVSLGAIASLGNWEYINNVSGEYKDYEGSASGTDTTLEYNYYVKGLKVGDAPQQQYGAWVSVYPLRGLDIQVIYRYNAKHFADWDPFSRTDEADDAQVWETPAYSLIDLHANYRLPFDGRTKIDVFFHVFNVLDAIYVQDAVDNSRYNGYYGTNNNLSHTANSAEVFLGLPRTFNAGLKVTFN